MRHYGWAAFACAMLAPGFITAARADGPPITIGVPTSVQLEVGRDSIDATQLAIDEINAKGGVLGRQLRMIVADETENPQEGVAAINKLTADEHVDVLIGGYTSGVTLAQETHIADSKTIYLEVGAASPSITDFVRRNYKRYQYIFRVSPINAAHQAEALIDFGLGKLKGEAGVEKIAIAGENAKWVQDLAPILKAGLEKGGMTVTSVDLFDADTSDFSPLFTKIKASGAQYIMVVLSHANSDVFVKQWYDAKLPIPIGGIDVKSQDSDFFTRIGGKAVSETVANNIIPVPMTPLTMPFWNNFVARFKRPPVYTGAGSYDAVYIYAEAVARAGTTAPDKVIPALEKTHYVGTEGLCEFDAQHDIKYGPGFISLAFAQWYPDGSRVIVWPKEIAKGAMNPPPWLAGKP
ncbi:ABC transporter substrate-binding protein [Acidibrevibacterium fodinaquatile]|uniref:ABC transporter substrate-binding protein n=1 Tax=Acidibrevibacterium fodinaquatile TaxID=1969806 RepID=UPI000E0D8713|nr:ABC transporter substrate-binding protein [Acidibrevibacterium fodinaquatile]